MGAKGITIAEECHIVNILPPQDVDGGVTGDIFSMKNFSHCTIIVQAGSTNADAGNITVNECDDFTPSNSSALSTTLMTYAETTDSGDTLGARTNDVSIDVSANDNIFYVIELDASELSDGYPCVQLAWSDPGGATYGSAVAILSGQKYAKEQNATAIA